MAAAAGAALLHPEHITGKIADNGGGSYTVTLNGYAAVTINFTGDTNKYSTANGDWLKVLEKAYGQTIFSTNSFGQHNPYYYINKGNAISEGIKVLSGNDQDTDEFWFTSDATTRTKLTAAFSSNKLVTLASKDDKVEGVVVNHAYTVLAWDVTGDRVKVRNPHAYNPTFSQGGDKNNHLGKTDAENPNHVNNGEFWMPLPILTRTFAEICYEE